MPPDTPDNPSAPNDDFIRRLPAEVTRWQANGLISEEQAAAILGRYDSNGAASGGSAIGNRVVTVITIMGVSLIGLGVIAFIAANWSAIPALAKLALMVIGTPVIYIIGWFVGYRLGYARIGAAIILLGAIAFGASIHLIAQAYHVPVNHPNLVPLWFLGVVPLAYITRSRALLGLSLILFLSAAGFRSQEWLSPLGDEEIALMIPAFLTLGAFLFAAGRMQARFAETRQFARLCDVSGLMVVAVAIYVFSFNFFWEELGGYGVAFAELSTEYWLTVGIAGLAAALMVGVAGWRDAGQRSGQVWWEAGALAAMGLTAAAMWLGLAFGDQSLWWVFNLLMLAGVLAMIAAGYRWNRAWPINLAIAVFSITLFTRYFEFGFGLLGQSVAFIVAGIILLAGGFGMEYLRRRLVGRIRREGVEA
ncbi:MAG: DUF2157 domain-containing protein [Dehalococcoidia bacterium]|nr:DUF2157 domain-containing protein [Dehalococcoidia bacterium]